MKVLLALVLFVVASGLCTYCDSDCDKDVPLVAAIYSPGGARTREVEELDWVVPPLLSQCDTCGSGTTTMLFEGAPGPFVNTSTGSFLLITAYGPANLDHDLSIVQPSYESAGISPYIKPVTTLPSFSHWARPSVLFMKNDSYFIGVAAATAAATVYGFSSNGIDNLCANSNYLLPGDPNKYDALYNPMTNEVVVIFPGESTIDAVTYSLDGSNDAVSATYPLSTTYIGSFIDISSGLVNIIVNTPSSTSSASFFTLGKSGTLNPTITASYPAANLIYTFWNKLGPRFWMSADKQLVWGFFELGSNTQNPVFLSTDLASGSTKILRGDPFQTNSQFYFNFISPHPVWA